MEEKKPQPTGKSLEEKYSIVYVKGSKEVETIMMSRAEVAELKRQGYKPLDNRDQRRKKRSMAKDEATVGDKKVRPRDWREKRKEKRKAARKARKQHA